MPFSEKKQRLRHLRNGFSESARNSELEIIFKSFGLRHVIQSGSSHRLEVPAAQVFESKCSTERFDVFHQPSSAPVFSNP